MGMGVDVGTAVAYLDLNMTAFNEGLSTAETALSKFKDKTASLGDKISSIGGIASNVGSSLTRNLTVPIVSLGKSALDSYRSFESAFTGVRKTVDATEEEYKMLSKAIEDMAGSTASSAEDIAGVMEVAGQLGIELGKNGEEITKFTKIMVELGDSTNLTAEQAATALARFMNITGTATSDVDKLGSTIVDLGNNFAAQEDEIANMSLRLASAGTMAGLTETEILGLATAMTSVGIRAEAGGSSMSTTLSNIEMAVKKAISGDEGAINQLNVLADVSGMTASEFSNAWENDPIRALKAFLLGLNGVEEKGGSAVLVLDELGMSGIRQSNMLRALSLAGGELTDAIDLANNAWEENTALTTEAEKRYGTLDSRISQLNERWKAMKRDIAEMLIPILEKLMGYVEQLISWWNNLSEAEKQHIVKILEIVAALGPLLMIFGRLTSAIGSIMNIGKLLLPLLGSFNAPLIAIVAVIALAVKGLIDLWKNSDEFRAKVSSLFEKLKEIWKTLKPIIDTLSKILGTAFVVIVDGAINILGKLVDAISEGLEWIKNLAKAIMDGDWGEIGRLIVEGIIQGLLGGLKLVFAPIKMLFDAIWGFICEVFGIHSPATSMYPIGENILLGILEGFKNMMSKFLEVLQEFAQMVFDFFEGLWNSLTEFVSTLWESISGFFTNLWEAVSLFFQNTWDTISTFFQNVWDSLVQFIEQVWQNLTEFIQNAWSKISGFFEDVWNNLVELLQNAWSRIVSFFQDVWNKIVDFFQNTWNKIVEFFQNTWDKFTSFLSDLWNKITSFFEDLWNKITEFFQNMWDKLTTFMSDLWNKITEFFQETWNKIVTFFSDLLDKVASGLSDIWNKIVEFFGNLISTIGEKFEGIISYIIGLVPRFIESGQQIFLGLWEGIKSIWNEIVGWIEDKFNWVVSKVQWIKDKVTGIWQGIKSAADSIGAKISGVFKSHAAGLDYVPYNGYIAQLHQGERVLTKQEAREYNEGNNKTGGDTFIFNDVTPNPYEYARQIKRVKKELLFDN